MRVAIYVKNGEGTDTVPVAPDVFISTGVSGSTFTFQDAAGDLFAAGAAEIPVFSATGADAAHPAGTFSFAVITNVAISGSGPYTYTMTCDRTVPAAWGAGAKLYIGDGITFPAVGGANVRKLLSNNSVVGDGVAGTSSIKLVLKSAHTETIGSVVTLHCGTAVETYNRLLIEAEDGAAVRPVITFSHNGVGFNVPGQGYLKGFNIVNSSVSKTAAIGVQITLNTVQFQIAHLEDMLIDGFGLGVYVSNGSTGTRVERCEIRNCSGYTGGSFGITGSSSSLGWGFRLLNSWIHDITGVGIVQSQHNNGGGSTIIDGSAITACTSHGVHLTATGTGNMYCFPSFEIRRSVIANNGGDGIRHGGTNTGLFAPYCGIIENCHITGNTGYGINFSGGVAAATLLGVLNAALFTLRNCNFHGNGSGPFNPIAADVRRDCVALAPGYRSVATGDFRTSVGTGSGFPLSTPWSSVAFDADIGLPLKSEGGSVELSGAGPGLR